MSYKTELHAHSREVSPCADLSVEEVTERYIKAGYSTVVLTNHYTANVMEDAGEDAAARIGHFLSAYRKMKQYAKGRLHVLLGCELRFTENHNDYLILGMTEEFLYAHPNLHEMTLKSFSELAHEHGLLIFWAHPFRNRMTVVSPKYIDGVEVFNGHHGHDSRNQLADLYAQTYGLLRSSGSDFHHPTSTESAGIRTQAPITTMEELVAVLKSGECELICEGPAAIRDGMHSMPAKYEKKL